MEAMEAKLLAATVLTGLLILAAIIIRHSLGISNTFVVLAAVDLAVQYAVSDRRRTSMARRVLEGEEPASSKVTLHR